MSELEDLAAEVRKLGDEGNRAQRLAEAAAQRLDALTRETLSLRHLGGLDQAIDQLTGARRSAISAARHLHELRAGAHRFADRLVGGSGRGPSGAAAAALGGAALAGVGVGAATPPQPAPDTARLVNSPENGRLVAALAERGLTLEPVARFDYSDNPILGYRASGQPDDIAYAVRAWNDQIAPGIAAGASRADFAAYDEEHGLEGQRRLAGVYDYMLGDPVWGDERADGTLAPGGGRHRIEQARRSGVGFLPYKPHGRRT